MSEKQKSPPKAIKGKMVHYSTESFSPGSGLGYDTKQTINKVGLYLPEQEFFFSLACDVFYDPPNITELVMILNDTLEPIEIFEGREAEKEYKKLLEKVGESKDIELPEDFITEDKAKIGVIAELCDKCEKCDAVFLYTDPIKRAFRLRFAS